MRRKAATGRPARRSGRGFPIVRPLRTRGEKNSHKVRDSYFTKTLTGRVAGAGGGSRHSVRRADGKWNSRIPASQSSC